MTQLWFFAFARSTTVRHGNCVTDWTFSLGLKNFLRCSDRHRLIFWFVAVSNLNLNLLSLNLILNSLSQSTLPRRNCCCFLAENSVEFCLNFSAISLRFGVVLIPVSQPVFEAFSQRKAPLKREKNRMVIKYWTLKRGFFYWNRILIGQQWMFGLLKIILPKETFKIVPKVFLLPWIACFGVCFLVCAKLEGTFYMKKNAIRKFS